MIDQKELLDYKIELALSKVQLNKLPHSKIVVIAEALENYIVYLANAPKTMLEKHYLITAVLLYDKKFTTLINCRLPRKTTTLKLYSNEADTLFQAFKHYQNQLHSTNQHFAIIENLKMALYSQIA
ncbi:MAG: hypothetical protein ACM31G_07200 [Flavobacteriales bacterium]